MHHSVPSLLIFLTVLYSSSTPTSAFSGPAGSSSSHTHTPPPFQLTRLDHVVLRCRDYKAMFEFYTEVLGCTIDRPADLGRFGGALSHLRAGDAMIDLLSYDEDELTEDGKEAVLRMHSGGEGVSLKDDDDKTACLKEVASFHASTSTIDHLCIRADPFHEEEILEFMKAKGVKVVGSGQRYGSEGEGPSVYVKDPEGNVIELKGPPAANQT